MPPNDPPGPQPTPASASSPTLLGFTLPLQLLVYVGGPALGLGLGYLLPPLARRLATLPWIPFQGPMELIAGFDGFWVPLVSAAVGLVLGLFLAMVVHSESLRVRLTDTEVRLTKDEQTQTIGRSEVSAVYVEAQRLIILDRESRRIANESTASRRATIARAFQAHGYPWVERDPHAELYRRWVPETPELPGAVNAVLRARERSLQQKSGRDSTELATEVQTLGYVVRDDGHRQYWRPLVRS